MAAADVGTSELHALVDLISSSVNKIDELLASRHQKFPSSDDPFDPTTEAVRMSPDIAEQTVFIVAAASQLVAAVRMPVLSLMYNTVSFHLSTCIRLAIESHVAEVLRSGGTDGVHVQDIAQPTGVDPAKLARCLRFLATNHIFREISPNVFTNNKISSLLDTGKVVDSIIENRIGKHDGTRGLVALVEHVIDDGMKAASYLPETLLSPDTAKSGAANRTAFNTAFKTDLSWFPWLDLPENEYRLKRFTTAMGGIQNTASPGAILDGYDWKGLPEGSVVVDVGGGVGTHSLALAKEFSHLNFVVQDRDTVIPSAHTYWDAKLPDAIKTGRVTLQAHDFFKPQPVKEPAVFLLRMILHDWSDEYALPILSHLRTVAGHKTQLLVVDNTVSYACTDTTSARNIPGAATATPPYPLLANKGVARSQPYGVDLHMLALLNGTERTVAEFDDLFKRAGWKLERVFHPPGFEIENAKLIATPL